MQSMLLNQIKWCKINILLEFPFQDWNNQFLSQEVCLFHERQQLLYLSIYMLPLGYQSMVMVFLFNNLEGLIHIHSLMKTCLELRPMEDCQEEDHLIETHLEDHHRIHLLDFMYRKHLTQGYLCHQGINQFQFYLNQPISCHTKSSNIPHM